MSEAESPMNGEVYESPSGTRVAVIFGRHHFALLGLCDGHRVNPNLNAPMVHVEKDGTWLYSVDDLRERLKDWNLVDNARLEIVEDLEETGRLQRDPDIREDGWPTQVWIRERDMAWTFEEDDDHAIGSQRKYVPADPEQIRRGEQNAD